MKIRLLLDYHGDLARARAQLGKVPPTYFSDDQGALMASTVWLYLRDPVKCLEVLRPVHDYPQTQGFTGPKAYLNGIAQRLAGNEDATRTDWRAALRLVEQRLTAQPNASMLLWWKALLLAALGERAEVEPLLRELRQRVNTGDEDVSEFRLAQILVRLEKPIEAIASLEVSMKRSGTGGLRNLLRYDPEWDALRGNPRFEALLKMPEQKK